MLTINLVLFERKIKFRKNYDIYIMHLEIEFISVLKELYIGKCFVTIRMRSRIPLPIFSIQWDYV